MSIKAEIKELYHNATGQPLEEICPTGTAFCFGVRAVIGTIGTPAADIFDFAVCSPAWLEQESEKVGIVEGRHFFIMKTYDGDALARHLHSLISKAEGPDWETVAALISRWAFWEFEDYESAS